MSKTYNYVRAHEGAPQSTSRRLQGLTVLLCEASQTERRADRGKTEREKVMTQAELDTATNDKQQNAVRSAAVKDLLAITWEG